MQWIKITLLLNLLYDLGGYFDKKTDKRRVVLKKYPPKRVNLPLGYVGNTAVNFVYQRIQK